MRDTKNNGRTIKPFLILLLGILMLAVLCACGSENSENSVNSENTIKAWEPADSQDKGIVDILTANGSAAFAEYQTDGTFEMVRTGIEYYKNGKLVEDEGQGEFILSEDNTKAGVIGFCFKDGEMVIGEAAETHVTTVDHAALKGYVNDEEMGTSFASIGTESQPIEAGQKIYLGALNQGADWISADLLDDPSQMDSEGKTWLVYIEFSK